MALKNQTCSGVEALMKRKPISELRLQDPEIWDKVAWIRAHFVKDLDSGIRKMDFCNFVTQHLGRTGYRDVWHLLKIAYPHVDRVRKGRKYMYWGIKHSDKTIEQTDSIIGSQKAIECNNNDCNNAQVLQKTLVVDDATDDEACFERCPSIKVKSEKMSDEEDTAKSDDFLVMEFKEKDVFESFEDYEKSKEDRLCNGQNNERSVTPPLVIFTEHQMTDSSELPDKKNASNKQPEKKDETTIESSVFPSEPNETAFTTNLLKPENINRVCIPLMQDVKKRKNKGDDNTAEVNDENYKIDPVIVSVSSIGNNIDHNTDKTTSSDVQVVVVQDRGIQVCETSSNTTQRRKRNAAQAKSTDCNVQPSSSTMTTVCHDKGDSKQQPTSTNSRKKMKSATENTSSVAVKTKCTSRQEDPSNFIKVQTAPTLPLLSRGFTPSVTSTEQISGHSIVVLKPPVKSSTATISTTSNVASSPYIMPSLLNDRNYKTSGGVAIHAASKLPTHYRNSNGSVENPMTDMQTHVSRVNPNAVRPVAERPDYNQYRNRELVRKLLEEHESQRNSKDYTSENDLQYTVDCLSAELEKERSLRLRLEIELRKVENQLDQERKLNEKLAALLMKR